MSQVSRTTAKTYFNTGDIPTEIQFGNTLDSIPFFEDGAYTALSGTSWDGTPKRKLLTGNLALTLSTSRRSGKLKIIQDGTGSRTLTINSVSIPISTDPDSVSLVIFDYDDVAAVYDFYVDTSYAGNVAGGGTTPDAPTSGVVDDTADTFNWTNNPSFTALSDYEYTLNGGSSFLTVTAKPISVGNVNKAIGQVGVRVKAVGGNPASATLFNASAFNVAAGIDADAQAYIDALIAQGVTPDGTEEAGLDAFFSGLKTAGLWSKISHMGIHTWGGANPNGINARNPGGTALSWNGTWTYDADSSIPGSSAAAYRSGVFLSSIFTQDDAWMAHYPLTSTLVNSFEALCGGQLNDASKCSRIMHNGSGVYAEMNNPQESVLTAAAQAKLYISSRIASGSSKLWIDGTLIGTISTASTGVPGSVLATTGAAFTELGGNPYPSTRKFWFQVYGSGLFDATDAANFTALVEDLKPTLI